MKAKQRVVRTKDKLPRKTERKESSRKAREKLADSYFSIWTNLVSAVLITLVIAPMAFAYKTLSTPTDEGPAMFEVLMHAAHAEAGIFLLFYGASLAIAVLARSAAMKIYSELYPDGN